MTNKVVYITLKHFYTKRKIFREKKIIEFYLIF